MQLLIFTKPCKIVPLNVINDQGLTLLTGLFKVAVKSTNDQEIFQDEGETYTEGFEISLKLLPSIVLKM